MQYEEQIKKLEAVLKVEKDAFMRIKELDTLRYFYKENEKEKDRVKYNAETKELEYSRSIELGIELIEYVKSNISEISNENKAETIKIMQNNYYYLSGYLFSYFLTSIEFGIEPEKQFLAPRVSVLMPIAKKLEKFYYKPRGVTTISMPQRYAEKLKSASVL